MEKHADGIVTVANDRRILMRAKIAKKMDVTPSKRERIGFAVGSWPDPPAEDPLETTG